MRVYLAGPINGCTDEEAKDWRLLCKVLHPDVEWIDPMVRDYRGKEAECYKEIVELDKKDIDLCDLLVVSYTKPSVGTSMEILYAWERQKPVVLVCKAGENLSPWLLYHVRRIVHSYQDILDKIACRT